MNLTKQSGLVRRLSNEDIRYMEGEDPTEFHNYSVVVTRATVLGTIEDQMDVFTVRRSKERNQWWRFWEAKKDDIGYVYYLVDLRDRKHTSTMQLVAIANTYPLTADIALKYAVENAHKVALGVDDALGSLVSDIEFAIRKFVLRQNDLVALHDVEVLLNSHLKELVTPRRLGLEEEKWYRDVGIQVEEITVQITFTDKYYNDFNAYVEENKRKERDRGIRKRAIEEQQEIAADDVILKEIENQKQLDIEEEDVRLLEALVQKKKRRTSAEQKINVIEMQAQVDRIKTEEEFLKIFDDLKLQQEERKIIGERQLRSQEQKTAELLRVQAALANNKLLRLNTKNAIAVLDELGLSRKDSGWIVYAVAARMIKNPEEGLATLFEMTSKILEDNRNSAKEALTKFYEVTRPAVEAGFVSTNEFKQVVQKLIPALSGADIATFFQTESASKDVDNVISQQRLEYREPSVEDYDNYRTTESFENPDNLEEFPVDANNVSNDDYLVNHVDSGADDYRNLEHDVLGEDPSPDTEVENNTPLNASTSTDPFEEGLMLPLDDDPTTAFQDV